MNYIKYVYDKRNKVVILEKEPIFEEAEAREEKENKKGMDAIKR